MNRLQKLTQCAVLTGFLIVGGCGDPARDRMRERALDDQQARAALYPNDAPSYQQASPPYQGAGSRDGGYAAQPQPQGPVYSEPQQRTTRSGTAQASAVRQTPSQRPQPPRVLLNAGSTVFVSPRADICSSEVQVGSRFDAYVVEVSDGEPVGNVTFEVTQASTAGNVNERAELAAVPLAYERDGRRYPLSADVYLLPVNDRRLRGSGGRDARNAVVGAAVGAIAGQLIGKNTRSTVTGAAAGAAVGGGGSYATADRDVCVPVGARIAISVRTSVVE